MESLAVFYQILYEDLSPLVDGANSYTTHLEFLKKRDPDFKKHFKVKLRKTSKNLYKVNSYEEFCFSDFENMLYNEATTLQKDQELALMTEAVSQKLGLNPKNITNLACNSKENGIYCELSMKMGYDDMPQHAVKFYYYKLLLYETVKDFRRKLQERVFHLRSEGKIRLYVKQYQILIDSYMKKILSDHLPGHMGDEIYSISKELTVFDIYKVTFHSLEDILNFIERNYFTYMDVNMDTPYRTRILLTAKYSDKLRVVLNKLENLDLDPSLHRTLTKPFSEAGCPYSEHFSYKDLDYCKLYLEALYQVLGTNERNCIEMDGILSVLRGINFNSVRFFTYLTTQITNKVRLEKSYESKLEVLYLHQKLYNQLLPKTDLSYNPAIPSLKEQMTIWLKEEISFYERKLNSKIKTDTVVEGFEPVNRLKLKMSVPQLSIMIKVFYETDLLSGSRREILRFASRNYCTENSESISYDSLLSKYYQIEDSNRKTVLEILEKMTLFLKSQ